MQARHQALHKVLLSHVSLFIDMRLATVIHDEILRTQSEAVATCGVSVKLRDH